MVELTRLQQTVARRMAESKATAPHFYLSVEADMSRCVEARARIKAQSKEGEVMPSFNDMVVKAAAIALREHPRANGAYRDGKLELYSRVNVGVAVAAQNALVVPTIFDADQKGLRRIAEEARALAQRVREGTVNPPELSGGTFTVSNLGMYGIESFAAVINPPQAGILAVGAITERPVVRDGEITTAQLMPMNLACDHRILYGADGAEFLARIRELLEEPLGLALSSGASVLNLRGERPIRSDEQRRVADRWDEARQAMDAAQSLAERHYRCPEVALVRDEALRRLRRTLAAAKAWGALR